jgi:cytochrome P450
MRAWIGERLPPPLAEMPDRELAIDQAVTLLATGREPVAAALAWGVARLHCRPAELRALRSGLPSASLETILASPALRSTVSATLKEHPPVPVIVRRLAARQQLGGRDVRAGAEVVAPAIDPHGGGAHRCLGPELSRVTLAVVLAAWAARHRFEPVERGIPRAVRRNAVVIPEGGLRVRRRAPA